MVTGGDPLPRPPRGVRPPGRRAGLAVILAWAPSHPDGRWRMDGPSCRDRRAQSFRQR